MGLAHNDFEKPTVLNTWLVGVTAFAGPDRRYWLATRSNGENLISEEEETAARRSVIEQAQTMEMLGTGGAERTDECLGRVNRAPP